MTSWKITSSKSLFVFATIVLIAFAAESEGRKGWQNPNDPTFGRYSAPSLQGKIIDSRGLSEVTSPAPPTTDQNFNVFRLFVSQLMRELKVDVDEPDRVDKNMRLSMSKHAVSVLSNYLNGKKPDNQASREEIRSVLSGVFSLSEEQLPTRFEETMQRMWPWIATGNLFILPAAVFFIVKSILRPRAFWVIIVSTIFLVSVYTTYNKKYQEAEARRFAQIQMARKGDPCAPEGLAQRLFDSLTSFVHFRRKTSCQEYIEAQTMSIFNEISLVETFFEVLSSGFFSMFSGSATHINKFFKNLYDGAPLLAQIVMTAFLILVVGKIKTPFFSYEPAVTLSSVGDAMGAMVNWVTEDRPEHLRIAEAQPTASSTHKSISKPSRRAIENKKETEVTKKGRKIENEDYLRKKAEGESAESCLSDCSQVTDDESSLTPSGSNITFRKSPHNRGKPLRINDDERNSLNTSSSKSK
ncbi:unnamed protein product [Caenorhabditis auriculariae]|uniref:Chloride channel CLIC-like protein 1 n=1 Tax=Caenorhabditis auriculariae TaxID=2777116 RepID=A0A8S1GQL8_9PELO|nr:unnamed protein product [Caenorhabditis auriculariae]